MLSTGGVRRQLLISMSLMAVVVVGIAWPLSSWLIDRSFGTFEIGKAEDDADRLQILITQRADRMRTVAVDYARWTEAVDYIQDRNPDFIAENIGSEALINFDADYTFITDSRLKTRYLAGTAQYTNPGSTGGDLRPLPPEHVATLISDPRIRAQLTQRDGNGFLFQDGDHWSLVGIATISYPDNKPDADSYGLIGFVSELTPARIQAIESIAKAPFSLHAPALHPEGSVLDDGNVVTHRILRDARGMPMAILNIHSARPLAEQAYVAQRALLAITLGIFLSGSFLVWLLVDRGVIVRLERMDKLLNAIANGTQNTALPVTRHDDEVDRLAQGFNRLYSELHAVNQTWRHEALHDPLTGLGNRAQLLRQIESHLDESSNQRLLGLLLLDLDGFKTVNDIYGHAVGDHVLKRVASCLREALPKKTPCFRLGGDEFAVLVEGYAEPDVHALAANLNTLLRSSNFAENIGTLVSVSIGIAWAPAERRTMVPSELMQRADIALYSIKRSSGDGYAIFNDSMLRTMQHQSDIQRSLREAIDQGGIETWFQPIVSAQDRQILRFEVLARWQHETIGWVPPTEFVAVAEQFHIAVALDLAVLRKGLSSLPSLRAFAPEVGLSVNVSAQSLLDSEYPRQVERLIAEYGLCGADLILEVTETTLTQNEDALLAPITALHALGIRIELDDFGVGHSSLGRLAQLQPHGIKLDGSFVHNLHNGGDRVCRAVIGMAQQLGIQVTAECVERPTEADFLEAAGCNALQGYLFSHPLSLVETLTWLSEQSTRKRAALGGLDVIEV